jgi:HD-like signal output (HDOD) protein
MPTATLQSPQELTHFALSKLTALGTLPEVTNKIIATVEDPRSSAAQLHKIVSHDPALVTRILKVVNSAFYGLPGQIGSVDRAIVLLGLNAVKNISIAASLGQMFRTTKLCEGYTAKDLWTHCIAVAICSRELAKRAKLAISEEAFLAGMIHDVGILVTLQTWPEQLRDVCDQAKAGQQSFVELENKIIGVDHQMLGKSLAAKWQFPLPCQLVAGHHHDPAAMPEGSRALVSIVHVADTLCAKAGFGFGLTAKNQTVTPAHCGVIKIDPSTVEEFAKTLPDIVKNAASFLA